MQVFSKFKLEKLKLTHFKIDFRIIINLYLICTSMDKLTVKKVILKFLHEKNFIKL